MLKQEILYKYDRFKNRNHYIWNQEAKTLRALPIDLATLRYQEINPGLPLINDYPLFRSSWHPDGSMILFYDSPWVFLYDLDNDTVCEIDVLEPQTRLELNMDAGIQWSPDGRFMTVGFSNKYYTGLDEVLLGVFDTYTGQLVVHPVPYFDRFDWSPDSQTIAIFARVPHENARGSAIRGIYLLNVYNHNLQRILPQFIVTGSSGKSVLWSPEGDKLAVACRSLRGPNELTTVDQICISKVTVQK